MPDKQSKKPQEMIVKDILADGTIVYMSRKEAAKRRKSLKTRIRDEEKLIVKLRTFIERYDADKRRHGFRKRSGGEVAGADELEEVGDAKP